MVGKVFVLGMGRVTWGEQWVNFTSREERGLGRRWVEYGDCVSVD